MKPIRDAWMVLIEVTSACFKSCIYCTRMCGHLRADQRFFMDLPMVAKAIESYAGWPRLIGIIGGEPTLHPQFEELCRLLLSYYPKEKYHLLTTGGAAYRRHRETIERTFAHIAINEHNEAQEAVCLHQPLTVAIDEVVPDQLVKKRLIDDCWVQMKWCPTIGPKGAFFCEVAYTWDLILDGPGGYPVEPGWWHRGPAEFSDQVERYCGSCGMPVPMSRQKLCHKNELATPLNLEAFTRAGLKDLERFTVFEKKFTPEEIENNRAGWHPSDYRQDAPGACVK